MKIVQPSVTTEFITPNAALLIERAGRTCYRSEGKAKPGSAAPFVKRLIDSKHESVLEHAYASFRVVSNVAIQREARTHRISTQSCESTRYCNYSNDAFGNEIKVIQPYCKTEKGLNRWHQSVLEAEQAYFDMLSYGEPPEVARDVLQFCLACEYVWTANFRSWLHIIELRTAPSAHPQMRQIATMIQDILKAECPEVFAPEAAVINITSKPDDSISTLEKPFTGILSGREHE